MTPTQGMLEDQAHHLPLRIYYEDTDASGIVYHARYLGFCERARSEFLRCLDIDHVAALNQPVESRLGFAVRRCEMDYLQPALLDDRLMVTSRLTKLAAAYTDIEQVIRRDDTVLVQARLRVAMVDGRGRPARIPKDWRQKMAPYVMEEVK